jgi:hypothetical protein
MSSIIEQILEATDNLKKISLVTSSKKKVKIGIVFLLISSNEKSYVGYEYDFKLEVKIKDLILRHLAYSMMGILYEASNEVLENAKDEPIKFEVILLQEVKNRYELAELAESEMRRLGKNKCVNIWNPIDIEKGEDVRSLYKSDARIRKIEKYKIERENEMMQNYLDEGYSKYDSLELVKEERRDRLNELRKVKDILYDEWIVLE